MVHLDRALFTSGPFPLSVLWCSGFPCHFYGRLSLPPPRQSTSSCLCSSSCPIIPSTYRASPSQFLSHHGPPSSLSTAARLFTHFAFSHLSSRIAAFILLAPGPNVAGRAVRFLFVTRGHHGLARPFVAPMSATSRPRSDTRGACVVAIPRFGGTIGPTAFSIAPFFVLRSSFCLCRPCARISSIFSGGIGINARLRCDSFSPLSRSVIEIIQRDPNFS